MKKNLKISLVLVSLAVAIFTAHSCLALSLVDTSGGPTGAYATGNYTLNNIRDYAVYIMKLILGLVGTLSLAMFVYGGISFLISSGNSSEVKKGTDILKAAVVGLLITFASVMIINLFFGGLGITWNQDTGEVYSDKCSQSLGKQGYSCMDEANGTDCKTNLCPGGATNLCCKAK